MGKRDRSAMSKRIVPPTQCTAHSSRTGDRCKKMAIVGHHVCNTHGGSSPAVREAARKRFLALVDDAVYGIEKLAGIGGHGLAAETEAVRLRALQDILDRAGLKVTDKLEVTETQVTNEDLDARIMAAFRERDQERES